jgi:hypothetical protein
VVASGWWLVAGLLVPRWLGCFKASPEASLGLRSRATGVERPKKVGR